MEIKIFQPSSHKIKAVVYGPSGAGKTVFGSTAPKPIFASAEAGLLSTAGKNTAFVEIKTFKDLLDMLDYLKNKKHDFETVVIDSITEINDIIKLDIERKAGRSMQLQDWGDLAKKIKAILRGFRDLPMHVLFIAQEMNVDDEGKISKIVPSLNGKAATEIAYFMDIVGYLSVDSTGARLMTTLSSPKLLTKDRTPGTLIGNETEIDFSVWCEKVKNIKTGVQEVLTSYEGEDPTVDDPKKKRPTEAQYALIQWYIESQLSETERKKAMDYLDKKMTMAQAEKYIKERGLRYENGHPTNMPDQPKTEKEDAPKSPESKTEIPKEESAPEQGADQTSMEPKQEEKTQQQKHKDTTDRLSKLAKLEELQKRYPEDSSEYKKMQEKIDSLTMQTA